MHSDPSEERCGMDCMDDIYLRRSSDSGETLSKQSEYQLSIENKSADKISTFIMSSQLLDRWIYTKTEMPSFPSGALGFLIPKTRYNLNCNRI